MSDSTQPKKNSKIQMAEEAYPELQMPLGYEEICKILPHRYPFLLVDRIIELEPGYRCVGVKNVTANEEFFQGHFPAHPVMPGVLILEAMAQVAGVLTLVSRNMPGAVSYFAAIEKARFRQPLRPGDQLITEATLQVLRRTLCKVRVEGRVDGQVAVEAEYTFVTADTSTSATTSEATQSTPVAIEVRPGATAAQAAAPSPIVKPVETITAHSNNGHSATSDTNRTPLSEVPREYSGPTYIHPTASVDPGAELDEHVWIGPYCLVEGGTRIGSGTILEANITVKRGTTIGRQCRIFPHSILGHDPQDVKYKGEETFLRIGDNNVLREMVTLHRATGEGEATTIGNDNMLMAYAHVGHNCTIGSNIMISNSTGISGHVTVEDKVVIGGFVGIHQFVHVGKMAMVGGVSKVVQDVPPFCICDGRPAKIYGLNNIGLRRNGVPAEERNQMSQAFKLLYRSDLNTTQALEKIAHDIPRSETLDYMLDFIERVRVGRLGRQDETAHL